MKRIQNRIKEERIELIACCLAKDENSLKNIRWILHQLKDDDIEYLYNENKPYETLDKIYGVQENKKTDETCF